MRAGNEAHLTFAALESCSDNASELQVCVQPAFTLKSALGLPIVQLRLVRWATFIYNIFIHNQAWITPLVCVPLSCVFNFSYKQGRCSPSLFTLPHSC